MRHTVNTQKKWAETTHILRDYLLNTSIPFVFQQLFKNPNKFNNKSWDEFLSEKNKDGKNDLEIPVWEIILRDILIKVFRERLLGSQTNFDDYVQRSEKYLKLFDDMIGGQNCSTGLPGIIQRFYEMTDDYLRRNFAGCITEYKGLTTKELLSECKKAYSLRRLEGNLGECPEHYFYVDFEGQAYSSALLEQFDKMSEDTSKHPNSQHYLIMVELLLTLFIYVYMVEFIIYRPFCGKNDREDLSPLKDHTLFKELKVVNYKIRFSDELKRINEINNNLGRPTRGKNQRTGSTH